MFCFVVSMVVLNWISLLLVVMIYLAVHFMWLVGWVLDVWFGVLLLVNFGGVSLAVAWLLNGGFLMDSWLTSVWWF